MQLLIYRLLYPVIWILSRLPWSVFYKVSDLVYYFVYYIIRYRRKTVLTNLQLAFPDKTASEYKKISKASYKHMCDMFLEMARTLSISKKEMVKRFAITNLDMFTRLSEEGRSIIVTMGHYNSYEWSNAIEIVSDFTCVGVYKPLKNKYFDALAHRIRGRFGSQVVAKRDIFRKILIDERKKSGLYLYGLISDQSPKIHDATFWTDFFNIKVPTINGAEVIGKKMGLSVYYLNVEKVKRGFYSATLVPISEDPKNEDNHYITKRFIELLENQIKSNPGNYLWTHKRWKHRNAPIPKDVTIA
ncbi:lipid A biosynthesis acyltransferase [Aquimarina sp. ERC-38]|uniref:lysophospholipid acyltransferase family protein n=1 Tax=Aquimarina sp. ERC-38 TaxID=2949996 RepID=UPI002247DC9C|nr:lipid A biosynthesis acyltransferase [Aquimarina sp. ERC-38]UZO79862.1 lipid A biosynthesis acyltransferase [Aquimarina sp. ERC-38]